MDEHALASLNSGSAVQKLVCGRPAQDQRGRLRGVNTRRDATEVVGAKSTIGYIGSDDRHVSHTISNLKALHAIAELIDLPDDIISQHKRGTAV
jgi:hypothetical protein